MKVQKIYIIRIDTPASKEYAEVCAKTCEDLGIEWEYFDGYKPIDQAQMWNELVQRTGLPLTSVRAMTPGAAGCTASHAHLWKQIADKKECAIILEHDAIMLHKLTLDIPHDRIVVLGYKYYNASKYDHNTAGAPQRLVDVDFHPGSHGYALTYEMAQMLCDELVREGVQLPIDNRHFLPSRSRFTQTKMAITDPICSMGWLRESTIWGKSASENNTKQMLQSFKDNFSGILEENIR